MINKPILITGCARSGTSMTAGIIEICGAWGGKTCGPTPFNPKGQFENRDIVNHIIKPFLKELKYDPMGQRPLPDPDMIDFIATPEFGTHWNSLVLHVLKNQGLSEYKQWYLKDTKPCITWQVWHAAFPNAQWVIPYRNNKITIDSLMKTSFMRRYKTREGWQRYIDYHRERVRHMVLNGLDVSYVNTELLVKSEWDEMKAVIKHLGLEWNQKKIEAFIDPKLWKATARR